MPPEDAAIPVVNSVVQRGARLYVSDHSGHEKLVATCPSVSVATWVGWSIAQTKGGTHKVEPAVPPEEGAADDEVFMSLQFTGPLDDARVLSVFGILSGNVPLVEITPELRRQAVQEIMQA